MAVGFLNVTTTSRARGQSATAAAAYRTGMRIDDARTGESHDYTKRGGVASVDVVGWQGDAPSLANAMEAAERRKDAKVARECLVALPAEATAEQRREIAVQFASWIHERHGTPAIVAVHEPGPDGDQRNWHAHILMATRASEDGLTLGAKARELDVKTTSDKHLEAWRQNWGERVGVDMRSYKRQGIEREPEPKMYRPERRAEWREARSLRELIGRTDNQIHHLREDIARAEQAERMRAAQAEQLAGWMRRYEQAAQRPETQQRAREIAAQAKREEAQRAELEQQRKAADQALNRAQRKLDRVRSEPAPRPPTIERARAFVAAKAAEARAELPAWRRLLGRVLPATLPEHARPTEARAQRALERAAETQDQKRAEQQMRLRAAQDALQAAQERREALDRPEPQREPQRAAEARTDAHTSAEPVIDAEASQRDFIRKAREAREEAERLRDREQDHGLDFGR